MSDAATNCSQLTHLSPDAAPGSRGLRVPFDGASITDLKAKITSGQFKPIVPGRYSPELVGLMTSLLSLNPSRRPTLVNIFVMPQCQARLQLLPPSQLSILPPAVMKTIQVCSIYFKWETCRAVISHSNPT